MVFFRVGVQVSSHLKLLREQEHKSEAKTARVAIREAAGELPRLLFSVMAKEEDRVDTITFTIELDRPIAAETLYRWLCERSTTCGSLFYLIDPDDEEPIEIVPDVPK